MPAVRIYTDKQVLPDGSVVEMVIWQVPKRVPGSGHEFKYRLYFGKGGERRVGYDNEAGKGDHRHYGDRQQSYRFVSPEQLAADFLADVKRWQEENL
jgi:hypothetical protein